MHDALDVYNVIINKVDQIKICKTIMIKRLYIG
jgi:hypothetical protein